MQSSSSYGRTVLGTISLEWSVVLTGALLAALAGILRDVQFRSPGLADVDIAAFVLAANLAHALVGLLWCWFIVRVLSLLTRVDGLYGTVGATTAWFVYVVAAPLLHAYHTPVPWRVPTATVPLILFAAAFGICLSALAARWAEPARHAAVAAALGALAGLFIAVPLSWGSAYGGWGLGMGIVCVLAVLGAVSAAFVWRKVAPNPSLTSAALAICCVGILAGAWFGISPQRSPDHKVLGSAAPAASWVVLISIDTLRADVAVDRMPNLQRFGEDSIVFENAYSPAPWTVPGLISLLTGLHPLVHGGDSMTAQTPEGVPTIASFFRDAGYSTIAVGMNPFIRMARMDRDFGLSLAHPTLSLGSTPGVAVAVRLLPHLYKTVPSTPELTRWAMDEIDAAGDQTEFLLWLHYYDPHDPYGPPDEFLPDMPEMQGDPDVAAPLSRERLALNSSAGGPVKVTPDRLQWIRGLYEGEAAFVDANVARVLGLLRERGLYDDALIVVTSDHGEEMFEHGQFGHVRTLYDEVLRVPLMIKLPGNSVKRRIATPVETTSVLPTILEVAGVTYDPKRFSALSLTPLWSDADSSEWPPVYAYGVRGHDEPVSVIHNGRKLIFEPSQQHEQFFDLQADPGERNPQSGESFEHAQQLRALLGAELERAEKMRAFYGIEKQSSKALDQDSADVLRSLGYIQ